MAAVNFNADIRIRVVFPLVTKSLKGDDRTRLNTTSAFTYTPKPQVDAVQSAISKVEFKEPATNKQRAAKLQGKLGDLLDEIEKVKKFMAKKAKNVVFEYDPALTQNELYADAEETLFGYASGKITYEMFEKILNFEEKIDRWIAHQSIANGGSLNGA